MPILFVALDFPPKSDPGVFRSLYFVQNLIKMGYQPIVLTVSEAEIIQSGTPIDQGLMAQIPEGVEIIRIPTGEPRKFIRLMQRLHVFRIFWSLAFPLFWEPTARWPWRARKKALELIREHKIELLYTTSGPFSPLLFGYLLKRSTKIKWVADIRDPYTDGYMWRWPGKFHWYLRRWIERFLLRFPEVLTNGY